jgi:hypothetical protein
VKCMMLVSKTVVRVCPSPLLLRLVGTRVKHEGLSCSDIAFGMFNLNVGIYVYMC